MNRQNGFYWVKVEGKRNHVWIIAEWRDGVWWMDYYEGYDPTAGPEEINETRIKNPDEV